MIRPLNDKVLVKRIAESQTTEAGLHLPESALGKSNRGEVVAVGNGRVTEEGIVVSVDVKVGDKILFGKYAGTDLTLDGEEILIVGEHEILGVIE